MARQADMAAATLAWQTLALSQLPTSSRHPLSLHYLVSVLLYLYILSLSPMLRMGLTVTDGLEDRDISLYLPPVHACMVYGSMAFVVCMWDRFTTKSNFARGCTPFCANKNNNNNNNNLPPPPRHCKHGNRPSQTDSLSISLLSCLWKTLLPREKQDRVGGEFTSQPSLIPFSSSPWLQVMTGLTFLPQLPLSLSLPIFAFRSIRETTFSASARFLTSHLCSPHPATHHACPLPSHLPPLFSPLPPPIFPHPVSLGLPPRFATPRTYHSPLGLGWLFGFLLLLLIPPLIYIYLSIYPS